MSCGKHFSSSRYRRRRVIVIVLLHRKSFADAVIGQLLARPVTMPSGIANAMEEALAGNRDAIRFVPGSAGLGSIWMMPGNPAVDAMAENPVAPTIPANSIVAVYGNGPVATGDDSVVTYRSGHLDNVKSELVVSSGQ
jgi:hypothetical protein